MLQYVKRAVGLSGNNLDYYSVKGTTAIDFRSDNLVNFDSLEKLDRFILIMKSIYLQNRENLISNSDSNQDDWGALDN